jgi:hypothetical protein
VAWVLKELTVGWPPSARLVREPGDEGPLHRLFVFLEDKMLLRHGYGTRAGITDLDDLSVRVDEVRPKLVDARDALRPKAPISAWLRKLSDACDELLGFIYDAMSASDEAARNPDPSVVAPAVDQLREAFRLVADHVWDEYELPAARNLASRIAENTASPPTADR